MIATSGARIVTNFSSNMHLRSGLAPIAAAHRCGCAIAVGVDGLALDEDDDVLREMRLVQMFHGGLGFKRTWTPQEFFGLAVANGRKATGAPGTGALAPGAPADFVAIDFDRLGPRSDHAGRSGRTSLSRAATRRCCAMWLWTGARS
jgi:cytosine/adenosine deaminase-related metal-dependent hydrolase